MNTTDNKQSSDFLNEDELFQKIEKLESNWGSSECYLVRINGEQYFMKRLSPEHANDPKYRLIIEKEYKIGKQVESCYTPRYHSINNARENTYILMEYINGSSIEQKLNCDPNYFQNKKNIYKFVTQLLCGLRVLHSKKIIHLDLNPHNIILTQIGNDVKIVDFGFSINDTYLHTAGTTAGFAAPELLSRSFEEIDESTDIYAVGALLQYIQERSGAKLPKKLQCIKERCMQKEKGKRYSTVDEILKIIEHRKLALLGKWAAAVAAIAVLATLVATSGLLTALDNYIGWEKGRFPARFEADGIFYNITDHKARTVEVTFKGNTPEEFEYEYTGGEVDIPQTVTYYGREFTVTGIAGDAFLNPYINKINIPEGVTTIKGSAFRNCLLEGIICIPGSVKEIGKVAFYPIQYIDGFVVDSANSVYDSRENCFALVETATNTLLAGGSNSVIPNTVTSIAEKAFIGTRAKTLDIPQSVTSIGRAAFVHSELTEVHLPDNITVLDEYLFQWSEKLRVITLPKNLKEIKLAALSHCAFSELVIPDGVTTIGDYAFDYCELLKKVTIGKGVESIGEFAFDGCRRLSTVVSHIPAERLFEVNANIFRNIGEGCVLYVPKGAKAVYKNTIGWDRFTKIVEM